MIAATVRIVVEPSATQSVNDVRRLLDIWLASNLGFLTEVISEREGVADCLRLTAGYVQNVRVEE